ncbi:MAG: T9SS type A sorting domain-containing protein, partial [Bacteroidales bacterium]|nr:T9SS type A sorting domain-containing protein [Bacteroidales bacterium]
ISENNSLYFVIEIESSTGGTSQVIPEMDLQLFPNPASDVLHITIPTGTLEKVWIHDLEGRQVLESPVSGTRSASISLQSLRPGTYVLGASVSSGTILLRPFGIVRR